MTKKEMMEAIAKQTQLTMSQVEEAFKATFQVIQQALIQDGKVAISDFGNFTTKVRAERKGRHPSTGKEMIIPQATVAVFKPSAQLKDAVNTNQESCV